MSVKVSVIIPVYNASRYLEDCISSLIGQTLRECEFIFVNDGSSDDSKAIIEKGMQLDPRIQLINQVNQGVSIARNTGLLQASGEYIGFVDADDQAASGMFETLYHEAVQWDCDMVISDFETTIGSHTVVSSLPLPRNTKLDKPYIREHILPGFVKFDHLNAVWNKLYRGDIIKRNQLCFPEKVALGEDAHFNILYFSHTSSVVYIDYCGYYYREAEGSATRNKTKMNYFGRAIQVYESLLPDVYINLLDQQLIRQLKSEKLINTVLSLIHFYFEPSTDMGFPQRYQYIREMIRHRSVREALPLYFEHQYVSLGRYHRFQLKLVQWKLVPGLYLLTAYSRMRNK